MDSVFRCAWNTHVASHSIVSRSDLAVSSAAELRAGGKEEVLALANRTQPRIPR